jgi:Mrp family chromosome partitioning ATPase/capsular polysaccharide biosynthesis protein
MSTTRRPEVPRYATLRDYLRVIRRHRLLIVVVALACTAAAYVATSRQKRTYTAQASVYFQDPTQELNLLGNPPVATIPVVTLAQISAQRITGRPIILEAQRLLGPAFTIGELSGAVGTAVNTQTYVVGINASSEEPRRAQQIANAFAQATRLVGQRNAREQYAAVATTVKKQFKPLIATADPGTRSVYRERIATVQVLAKSADPVQIVQTASLPVTPSGPRTVRNTIVGLLFGITLGLIAAFLRDAVDRRLRAPAEIGAQLGWSVLAHVREDAFKAPAFLSAGGQLSGDERDREAFRMLRENIRFLQIDDPPRSLAVTSALPEEGKSTVAVSLACASAAAGVPTLLVECDLRRPSLADRYGLEKGPGLADFLLGTATPDAVLQMIDLPAVASGSSNGALDSAADSLDESEPEVSLRRLVCITAGRAVPETAELLRSVRFKHFLMEVSSAYELVILDCGPLLSVADTTIVLAEAQAALICVRSGKTTIDEATALREAVARLPDRPIGVVVTGVRPGVLHDEGYYSYLYEARA